VKKRVLLVLLAMVLVVSMFAFAACAKEEEAPPVTEEWQWPEKLPLVGATFGVHAMAGWSSLLAQDTGMTVRIVDETHPELRFKWLGQGRFVYTGECGSPLIRLIEGISEYAERDGGPYQIRTVWSQSLGEVGFMVRGDSDIKTIYDIKPGTRMVDWVFAAGAVYKSRALLAWVGVDVDDIEWVPAGGTAAVTRLILDGKADLTFQFPAMPDVFEAAASPHGIRFIPLPYEEDPEGALRFLEVDPSIAFGVMSLGPPEVCQGIPSIVFACPTVTRAETDPELVYRTAKWLDENYDRVKETHAANANMSIDVLMTLMETHFVPAHDGLIRYLKEKGLWTAAHDARQAQNVELITRYCEAYQEAMDMADEQDIDVTPTNEEWLELWENYKQELKLPLATMFLGLEE